MSTARVRMGPVPGLLVGLAGGLVGLVIGTIAFVGGVLAFAFGGDGRAGAGLLTILFGLTAVVGAGLSVPKPLTGSLLLAASAIGSILAMGPFGVPMLILMGGGAYLACRGRTPSVRSR